MYRVAYTSHIDPADWARVTPAIVELDCGLHWKDSRLFADKLAKSDLAIFRFDAYTNVQMLYETQSESSLALLRDSLVRACWSEDSHHVWHMESELAPLFHHMFVAHSEYLSAFPEQKAHWLPTSFNSFSFDELIEKTSQPSIRQRDIIFPFRRYPDGLTNRNQIADEIAELCSQRKIKAMIGEVGRETANQESTTCNEILNSFGVLNVSLREELNQRVFTAHALNKPLLCDDVFDLHQMKLDLNGTVLFQRDLSDFDEKLDEFLAISPESVSTRDEVLKRHMHLHRVVEMINRSLDLQLKIEIPELGHCETPYSKITHGNSGEIPYPPFSHLDVRRDPGHRGLYGLYRAIRMRMKRRESERSDIHHPRNVRRIVEEFMQRA